MLNNSIKPELLIGTIQMSAELCRSVKGLLEQTRKQPVYTINCTEPHRFPREYALDILLIDLDNSTCNELRMLDKMADNPQTRIIVMSESLDEEQIISYYAHGVDDYIIKPCTYQELALRVDVLLRRLAWSTARPLPSMLTFDGISMDSSTNEVGIFNHQIRLNPIEFQLLSAFIRKPNMVIRADDLFREVWGYEVHGFQKLLDLAIQHLQQKVESAVPSPWRILTIEKVGYQFYPSETVTIYPALIDTMI